MDAKPEPSTPRDSVRVAAVQYEVRGIRDREELRSQVTGFVRSAAGYNADFVIFPELYTMQLLSTGPLVPGDEAMARIAGQTDWLVAWMRELAVVHRINIIGGTHPTRVASGAMRNIAYVFLRNGTVHTRDKIHPTPSEAAVWHIEGGDGALPIDTDCGRIGVLVCYDAEFPEPVRHLVDQGAMILFVPFCTDDRRGFLRVRYCCHARAIENQIYVVTAGVCGNLPNVENMDVHYAQSAVITPCDIPFAWDGIAADAPANVETMIVADLRLTDLAEARRAGSVRNLADRRLDLYAVEWRGGPKM
ncbi:MAG: carbon-nitrogen hydrolase family protein [Hyphomicrobiaceae bacterium]|nr:carbon-nitrogen hydrolase family protein [Hyphomicrobiaceae bacterium]